MPVIHHAGGVVYDHRNGAELNTAGADVDNHANVFVSPMPTPPRPYLVEYDILKLNLIQGYAVIPVSGHISVEELYLAADRGLGCKNYVDTTTDPHTWSAPTTGWLRLKYLETDYGDANSVINVPLLPWYDTICLRTYDKQEFRQFKMDNFFAQGAAASFGGMHHISAHGGYEGVQNPTIQHTVLHTDVVLPGSGTDVLDMDVDMAARVVTTSVVDLGGSKDDDTRNGSCDWASQNDVPGVDWTIPPRSGSTAPRIDIAIDVDVYTPTVGGGYALVGGLSDNDSGMLEAHTLPKTVGDDCMAVSEIEFDFDPEYRTLPITYGANTPILIEVRVTVDFQNGVTPYYAYGIPDETIFVEVGIERLSFRVN